VGPGGVEDPGVLREPVVRLHAPTIELPVAIRRVWDAESLGIRPPGVSEENDRYRRFRPLLPNPRNRRARAEVRGNAADSDRSSGAEYGVADFHGPQPRYTSISN